MRTNQRAGVAIVKDGKLLLLKRKKDEAVYYILPGGGVESEETPEMAAIRELKEELGIDVVLGKKIAEFEQRGNIEHYYLSENYTGEVVLIGDGIFNANIVDKDEWVSISDLDKINILPEQLKVILIGLFFV